MRYGILTASLLIALSPRPATAQLLEVRQSILGMD